MKDGISTDVMMKTMSDDAKVVLGGYFGIMGIPGKSTLSFGMVKSRPTERLNKALDECVAAGALAVERRPGGAVTYTVQVNCEDFGKWVRRNQSKGKWPATEPIVPRSELESKEAMK